MQSSAYQAMSGDVLTLYLIANGVLALQDKLRDERFIEVPYPSQLQKGLNRLTLASLWHNSTPPAGVPELLTWCTRPLGTWPLDSDPDIAGAGDTLLDGIFPTQFCQELAISSPDVEAELLEQHLLLKVVEICRNSGDQSAYVAFRRTLIEQPVLTSLELQQKLVDEKLVRLADGIRDAYHTAPAECIIPAKPPVCLECHWCGNLLVRLRDGTLRCSEETCNDLHAARQKRSLPEHEGVHWLRRDLRMFIAGPGRSEIRLAQKLSRLGLQVELWPGIDAYDLRVVFPSGEPWAVDVKDQRSPALLARRLTHRIPLLPAWERGFYVFPDERNRQQGYLRTFKTHASNMLEGSPPIDALMERGFLSLVKRHLGKERKANA